MKKQIVPILCLSLFLVAGCTSQRNVSEDIKVTTENFETDNSTVVSIMVPEDMALYRQKMTEYAQVGGIDPLPTTKFIQKNIIIPFTSSVIKASAETAMAGIPLGSGPSQAYVTYLNVGADTAYILLNIDTDSWAGVSATRVVIHPIIEKTLLLFPEIKKVVFDYAPADKVAEVKDIEAYCKTLGELCPEKETRCTMCGKHKADNYISCHSKEFCDKIPVL